MQEKWKRLTSIFLGTVHSDRTVVVFYTNTLVSEFALSL